MRNINTDTDQYKVIVQKLHNIADEKICYHIICQVTFKNAKRSLNKSPACTLWHISREKQQLIFDELSTLIEENVVKEELLAEINDDLMTSGSPIIFRWIDEV